MEGFLNPALALGALLAAVPLVIHLLNRRRHKPLAWGAMRFVVDAYRRTRRRARLEDLLLLLLRMAVVALLAFALARPHTGGGGALAGLSDVRRDRLVLLDTSASTGYRETVESVFERGVERARGLLEELDGGRGDRAGLVVVDDAPRLLDWGPPDRALSLLGAFDRPADARGDLAAALDEVLAALEPDGAIVDTESLEVVLVTDSQRDLLAPDDPVRAEPLAEALDRLEQRGLSLRVLDVGPAQPVPPNVGVTEVAAAEELLGAGLPTEFAVSVRNHGAGRASSVRVALAVDGERLPSRTLDLGPGEAGRARFDVTFLAPGPHLLEAVLEGDGLAFDDRRARVVEVRPPVRVLAVEGDPHPDDVEASALGLFEAVLLPPDDGPLGPGGFQPFELRRTDPAALGGDEVRLSDHDLVVLGNVETLSTRAVEALERRVAAGGALLIAVGDRVVPEAYDARLFARDGTGLLPAELIDVRAVPSRRDSYWRVAEFDEDHPALRFFADERWKPLLTEVPVFQFIAARPLPDARVLARLDDAAEGGSPLLIERPYHAGRVLLWTTTLNPDWTRLPESPRTLVPFVHELVRHAGRPVVPERNAGVDAPLVPVVDRFLRDAEVVLPDGGRLALEGDARERDDGRWELPPVVDTSRAGAYRVESDGRTVAALAVQADPAEGDLARLEPGALPGVHAALSAYDPDRGDGDGGGVAPSGELWRAFALACLAALVAESLFGAWLGRRRSRP